MKVNIDGHESLSAKYDTFESMSTEYIDHETKCGRRVPDYDLDTWMIAIALLFLDKAWDEYRDWLFRRQERQESQEQNELTERRHKELLETINEMSGAATIEGRAFDLSPDAKEQVSLEDNDQRFAVLQWAQENNVEIKITLETSVEGDLEEAFEELTVEVPGDTTQEWS